MKNIQAAPRVLKSKYDSKSMSLENILNLNSFSGSKVLYKCTCRLAEIAKLFPDGLTATCTDSGAAFFSTSNSPLKM